MLNNTPPQAGLFLSTMKQKFLIYSIVALVGFGVGVVTHVVSAQTTGDIPSNLAPLAEELGCTTRVACETVFNEQFEKGLELAEKYQVYDQTHKQLAQSFKSEILSKLADVGEEEFEERVVELARNIVQSRPALARQLQVANKDVQAADTIIEEIKNAGADIRICSQSADSLSREQLISCLNASKRLAEKTDIVKGYISEERLTAQKEFFDATIGLEEALARGEYRDLGTTADEIGTKCLRPGSPPVCDSIASRFFGPEGVAELARARAQIVEVENQSKRNSQKLTLTLTDGRAFVGKDTIRNLCDEAFSRRDVNLARSCGDFAVRNGFARQEDVEEGLKLLESFTQRGGSVDFRTCERDFNACRDYLPENRKGEFEVMRQISEIMRAEIGFNPEECDKGQFNPEIGKRCFEGAKRALPKIESLASVSPEAQRLVFEIKGHIAEGEQNSQRQQEIERVVRDSSGPGGCRTPEECSRYCSDSSHGPECIAFGARYQVFEGQDAVERFQRYNDALTQPFNYQVDERGSFRGQGPYQGFQPPGQGGVPPGQDPRFTSPGPGFGGDRYGGPNYGGTQIGPSPECFAAIQSGDYVRAKAVCTALSTPYTPQPPRQVICPALYSVDSCPAGQNRVVSYSSPECGVFYRCESTGGQLPTVCPADFHPYPDGRGVLFCLNDMDDRSGTCYELNSSIRIRCPEESISGGNCPSGYHFHTKDPGFCMPNSENPNEGCWDGSGARRIACPAISSHTYSGPTSIIVAPVFQCSDGLDNDNDGRIDYPADTGCFGRNDYDEASPSLPPPPPPGAIQCSDGRDNDNDGKVDYPADPSCYGPDDNDEFYPTGGQTTTWPCSYTTQASCSADPACLWNNGCGSKTQPSPVTGACAAEQISLLGSGCHKMNDYAYFNGEMTRYVLPGTNTVKECTTGFISGCSGGGGTYPGDANSCPGFSYSQWDSQGKRYCRLNSEARCDYNYPSYLTNGANYTAANCPTGTNIGDTASCDSGVIALLGSGCHYMYSDSSGNRIYCNGEMTKSAKYGDTAITQGCTSPGTTTPAGQKEQVWNSLGLRSSIRTDADPARIESLKQSCSTVSSSANVWMPSAGDAASADFGMPDPAKCQRAASCTSGQYFDGASCVSSTSTSQCSDGRDNDGDGQIDYPADTGCYSASDNDETLGTTSTSSCPSFAHEMGGYCMLNNDSTRCAPYSNASLESNYNNAGCTVTSTTCPSGQYWYTPPGGGTGYCTTSTTTTSTDCATKYGSGWQTMDSTSGNCFNSAMTEYRTSNGTLYSCSTTPASGCSSSTTTTTCPSGQYWNGTSCVSSTTTTCPSGQYWNGTACVSNTTSCSTPATCYDSARCSSAGWYWYNSGCWSTPQTTSTDCTTYGSGWHSMDSTSGNCFNSAMTEYRTSNGTLYSCSTTPASGCSSSSTTSCSTPSSCYDSARCSSAGWYWYNSGCWSTPQSSTTSTGTTACSDGVDNDSDGQIDYPADTGCYGREDSDEAYYPPPSSYRSSEHLLAQLNTMLGQITHLMNTLFR